MQTSSMAEENVPNGQKNADKPHKLHLVNKETESTTNPLTQSGTTVPTNTQASLTVQFRNNSMPHHKIRAISQSRDGSIDAIVTAKILPQIAPSIFVSARDKLLDQLAHTTSQPPLENCKTIRLSGASPSMTGGSKSKMIMGYVLTMKEAHDQIKREDGFINTNDQSYLFSYAVEKLVDLLAREHLNCFQELMAS